jgi:hypothetical protein
MKVRSNDVQSNDVRSKTCKVMTRKTIDVQNRCAKQMTCKAMSSLGFISASNRRRLLLRVAPFAAVCAILLASPVYASPDSPSVAVHLDVSKAAPRALEDQTARRILTDYRFAWMNLAQAVEANTLDPMEALFVGTAKKWLAETVASQRQSGLRMRYLNQNHKLEAVFYAPEGDVMELHDTAEYQLQVFDGEKLIYDQPVVMHYVVLMTPGADRWVIRQLQSVGNF